MAILATEKVLTLDHWKPAYKVQPGDYVFDRKGNLVRVKIVQEFRSEDCWEVKFDDHLTISGDLKLEFPTEGKKYRNRILTYKGVHPLRRQPKLMSLEQILESTERLSVPTCDPLQFPTQYLSIPAFVFGFWFFNRMKEENTFSLKPEHYEYVTQRLKDNGYQIIERPDRSDGFKIFRLSPSVESQLKPMMPTNIPDNYIMASKEQRFELLRGIIISKTRQYDPKTKWFKFSSMNLRLIKKIKALVESLGIKTTTVHQKHFKFYSLEFRTTYNIIPNQTPERMKVHQGRRYLNEFRQIKPQSCIYIQTDGPDGTFLVGEGLIACR